MASYTDNGAPDATALTANEIIRLGYPRIYAGNYSFIEVATKFTPNEEQAASIGIKPAPLVIGNDGGIVRYDDVDLTNVEAIALKLISGRNAQGGDIHVFLDDYKGEPVASINLPADASGLSTTSFSLDNVSGSHDLIISFEGNEDATVATLLWIDFLRGEAL